MKMLLVALAMAGATTGISAHPLEHVGSRRVQNVPQDINDAGFVVGYQPATVNQNAHALRWAPDGKATELPVPVFALNTYATAINSGGTIVGHMSQASGEANYKPVRWAPDGSVTMLATPAGFPNCMAKAVNDDGVAAGSCLTDDQYVQQPVRWATDGAVTLLKVSGDWSPDNTYAINADGTIIGSVFGFTEYKMRSAVVRWAPDGTMTEVSRLPGMSKVWDAAINRSGEIAGAVTLTDEQDRDSYHAVRWDAAGKVTDFGASAGAEEINDHGTIVGWSRDGDAPRVPTIWSADGTKTKLPPLETGGSHINDFGTAVNNNGAIAGNSGGMPTVWRQSAP